MKPMIEHGQEDDFLASFNLSISGGWQAVSAFVIICGAHVHWFLRPLNAMRYAESHEISKYERR
jgi:hypothetical protein